MERVAKNGFPGGTRARAVLQLSLCILTSALFSFLRDWTLASSRSPHQVAPCKRAGIRQQATVVPGIIQMQH
eukprot:1439277-Amphidinium_carterae.1